MADRLNFAFLGCGEIAVQTSKAALESRLARVVHCMDIRRDLAEDIAARHDARATDGLDEALDDDDVQAVYIPTPHFQHAPLAIAAAAAGKHVLVEKPMACTLAEADEMLAAAKAAGVQLATCFPQRLSWPYVQAAELVAAGAVGNVLAYKIHNMACKPPHYWHGGYTGRAQDDWRIAVSSSGGGFLIMNQIHNLDSMISVIDPEPQRIYAEYATLNTPVEVEDFLSFVMRLRNGALVSLDGASAAVGAESHGDRIYGTRGQIHVQTGCRVFLAEPWQDLEVQKWHELPAPEDRPNSRAAFLDLFAQAVLNGTTPPAAGREGRRSLEIARGAYLSMHRGRPVEFPVQE